MFLRSTQRRKDGKIHRYWSLVENRRVRGGRVVQRPLLYLGEINDSQREAWRKTIEVFEAGSPRSQTMALFPDDGAVPVDDASVVRIRLADLRIERPGQWGACWLAGVLYDQLGLDRFWAERLPPSRKGTRWDLILKALTAYRLIDPGSEWRLHRQPEPDVHLLLRQSNSISRHSPRHASTPKKNSSRNGRCSADLRG